MLFLHQLLPIFLLPLGVVFLLLAFWRRKRWPAVVAAVVPYLSSIDIVAGNLIGWLESRYPAVLADIGRRGAEPIKLWLAKVAYERMHLNTPPERAATVTTPERPD